MSIKTEAVYQCDFCEKETTTVYTHYFDTLSNWGRGHEQSNHQFDICLECDHKSHNRGFVIKTLMKAFGIR